MHLYVLARGQKDWLERWCNDLSAKYFQLRNKQKDGQGVIVQFGVRPVQLYEMVFPEEDLDTVLSMVRPYEKKRGTGALGVVLRRVLGLEALPRKNRPPFPGGHPYWVDGRFVGVVGVGLKRDERGDDGVEKL